MNEILRDVIITLASATRGGGQGANASFCRLLGGFRWAAAGAAIASAPQQAVIYPFCSIPTSIRPSCRRTMRTGTGHDRVRLPRFE